MRLPFRLENSAGHAIRGEVRAPRPGLDRGTVILCHGFKGFWNWGGFPYTLDALAAHGFFAIGFSFSGSGVSGGDIVDEPERFAENTISREVADLARVAAAAREGALPPYGRRARALGLVGHSIGGAVAIIQGANDPSTRAVVSWAAVSSFHRYPDEMVREWKERGWTIVTNTRTGQELQISSSFLEDLEENRERLDVLAAAGRLAAPLLVIHGDADESVPVGEGRAIHEASRRERSRLVVLEGEGHTFGIVHPFRGSSGGFDRVLDETIRWLGRHLDAS